MIAQNGVRGLRVEKLAAEAGDPRTQVEQMLLGELQDTAFVEGLSERWHSGSLTLQRARELLAAAIARELG